MSYSIADNLALHNVTLSGTANLTATGNSDSNVLIGNSGNNSLDGGIGAPDTLIGGKGDDVYTVHNSSDVVTENWDSGNDTIYSSVNYHLAGFVENLVLTGSADLTATGTRYNETLTGNSGNNVLDSGGGVDTLIGGAGNDTYISHSYKDVIVEQANGGIDTVITDGAFPVLPDNVENITLTGSANLYGAGNALNNVIIANAGNDTLTGAAGDDTFHVGSGQSKIDGGTGADTVVFHGNEADYQLATTWDGFTVSDANHVDGVTSIANVEVLQFADRNVNLIYGTSASETIQGGVGDNFIQSGKGDDHIIGGVGDDTIIAGPGNDTVDGGGGTDTVVFQGNRANYQVDSTANGYTVKDLTGADGKDTLSHISRLQFADQSIDLAPALPSAPKLDVAPVSGSEDHAIALNIDASLAADGVSEHLTVVISGVPDGATLSAGQSDEHGNWTLAAAQLPGLMLSAPSHVSGDFTLNVAVTATLDSNNSTQTSLATLPVHIEAVAQAPTLSAPAAEGNAGQPIDLNIAAALVDTDGSEHLAITIAGVPTDAVLSAGQSDGHGNWTLTGAELPGLTLTSSTAASGDLALTVVAASTEGANGNIATTSAGLTVHVAAQPVVVPVPDPPVTDTPVTTPPAEDWVAGAPTLFGTADHTTTGTSGNDIFASGTGAETLAGGTGDDIYYINNANAAVVENWNSGNDTILSSVNYQLAGFVDNLVLTGSADLTATGTRYNETLTGNSGNNVLDSGGGVDTLIGGAGNDTYISHSYKDVIVEQANGGIDTVITDGAFPVLPDNVENLTLTGSANLYGDGNALNNVIIANAGNDTLSGAAGDDTFHVGSGQSKIDGGTGVDTVVFHGNKADYQIAQTSTGWAVSDTTGHDGAATLTNVETLQFADQNYTLQSGSGSPVPPITVPPVSDGGSGPLPVTPPPTTTPGTPPPAPADGMVAAPQIIQPTHPGDVVGLQIDNTSGDAAAPRIYTIGQVFAEGDVPAGSHMVAMVDGHEIPLQMDVKTTNADGSVAHAILTMQLPSIAANGSVDVMLAKSATAAAAQPALDPSNLLHDGYDLSVNVNMHNADGSTTMHTVNAADALATALHNGTAQTWMDGSLATEVRVVANVTDTLHATFDIRTQADGSVHTDVSFGYNGAYTVGNDAITYDLAINNGGEQVYSQNALTQYQHTNWHQEVWSNGAPPLHTDYDVNYLVKTNAVPAFDTSIHVSDATLASNYAALQASDTGPMGTALNVTYMPSGGQTEGTNVGMLTNWQALYLLSQDSRAEQVMLANADAGGSAPWHFMDEATGQPISIDNHPDVRVSGNGPGEGADALPVTADTSNTPWTIDTAHQPADFYLPYLITGSHYYLDELQYQASYDLAFYNTSFRGGADGIINAQGEEQVRGLAWSLRTIADAAYASPDDSAMKSYFTDKIDNNLLYEYQHFVVDGAMNNAGAVEGWMPGDNRDQAQAAPWQQDFLAMTYQYLAQRGFDHADDMLSWMGNFQTGRYLNGDNGYNPAFGSPYELNVVDASTGQPYSSWEQVFNSTFGQQTTPTGIDTGSPGSAGAYWGSARGALAGLISTTQSPDAVEAYGHVVQFTQNAGLPDAYSEMPKWGMSAKLSNGEYLLNSNIQVDYSSSDVTLTAGDHNSLLYAGSGNDVLQGGAGVDLLFGGAGHDSIIGGAGDDFLFAGSGPTQLIGGSGNDYMKAGSGQDTFVFADANIGHDTIAGFKVGTDVLKFSQNTMTAADVLATATADAHGDTVLHLGQGNDIVLLGVQAQHLALSSIVMG